MAPNDRPGKLFGLSRQGWIGVAIWMSFGLLVEGLIGFRSPAYLQDAVRRELFRLAHTHGTVLSILLLVAYLHLTNGPVEPPEPAIWSLRIGTIVMPAGFLLGGIWHYESDPGLLIFLAPLGGLLVIFGVIAMAVTTFRK
jgi:uncharacterized membrane protein YgdD (TMEM256/DUF423 family)